jgi:hypothetical protein
MLGLDVSSPLDVDEVICGALQSEAVSCDLDKLSSWVSFIRLDILPHDAIAVPSGNAHVHSVAHHTSDWKPAAIRQDCFMGR